MTLPQTNCDLTAVRGAGGTEDFDRTAGAGPVKWTGRARAYLRQREERVTQGNTSSVVITRALIVPGELAVDWAEGDQLTLVTSGSEDAATVRGVERFRHPTAPSETRLVLEDA